jgi:hypothetical protein
VLLNWLAISPDFGEVSEWYSGWRSCFPVDLLEDTDMVEPFNAALNHMNTALTVEESECAAVLGGEIAKVPDTSYCAFYEKKVNELKMKERLKELNKDARYTPSSNGGASYSYGLGECTYIALLCRKKFGILDRRSYGFSGINFHFV